MSNSTSTPDPTGSNHPEQPIEVIELELTVDDQFYYASQEAGDTFKTLPYLMHTALYYALGFLPSQFRSVTDTPQYEKHYKNADLAQDIYIHPATPLTDAKSTTRRFACKGDQYRTDTAPENKNLKETGFQTYLNPGTTFRTFIRVDPDSDTTAGDVVEQIPSYIRTGKKMTTTRVESHIHTTSSKTGEFELGQPIAAPDIDTDEISPYKNLQSTNLNVTVIQRLTMTGEYVPIEPVRTPVDGIEETLALPTTTSFLGY